MDNDKKVLTWFLVGASVLAVVIFAWYWGKNSAGTSGFNAGGQQQTGGAGGVPSATRSPVSSTITVPNTDTSVPANIAKPQTVAPALVGSTASFRSFSITASGNQFIPSNVLVNVGDRVRLNIKAVDKDYDFAQPDYGLNKPLPKGQTTLVEFQATVADKYTFFCKSCGGPSEGPVGYIVIVPK